MKYRALGRTDLKISELGFGCASYWAKPQFDEKVAIKLIDLAFNSGVTAFDTGHSYSSGNAEKRLGKALSQIAPSVSDSLCLSTKAGTRLANNGRLYNDFSASWITESFYQSLSRLKQKQLGIFYLHGPNLEDFNDDLFDALLRLKDQGLVKALGVNAFDETIIRKAASTGVFDCIMLDYNLLAQHRNALIDDLYDQGIGVIAAAPLAGSLYSNRIFRMTGIKDLWYLARALKNSRKNMWAGRKYRFINHFNDYTGAQIALRFVLNNSKIACAVFGSTNVDHLQENLASSDMNIPARICEKIKRIGAG